MTSAFGLVAQCFFVSSICSTLIIASLSPTWIRQGRSTSLISSGTERKEGWLDTPASMVG